MSKCKIQLYGNWKGGWSLDEHTIKSTPLPGGGFDNEYTELGKLIYEIKYQNAKNKIKPLVNKLCDSMKTLHVTKWLRAIIPVPPSNTERKFQPVMEIADSLGKELKMPVCKDCVIKTKKTDYMKNKTEVERKKLLSGIFKVKNNFIKNKKVLLFDDIYETGSTLKEITRVLYSEGCVENVYVLTVTKTRSKQLY